MSKFTVTASELTSAAAQISEDNNQFRARVQDLITCADELSAMWEGEANTTFMTYFNNNQGNWITFANLIDQYVTALQNVAQIYLTAEATNVETAKTV